MAVPSTGPLSLAKMRNEILENNYNHSLYGYTANKTSLQFLSTGLHGTINQSANPKPDGSAPYAMSEFYGYDHDASSITQIGSTYTGQYSTSAWQTVSIDVTAYKGKTVRFIFHYVSGTSYTGDLQIDQVSFPVYFSFINSWAGITNTFGSSSFTSVSSGSNGGSWQTTTTDTSSYTGASWSTVAAGTTSLRWNGRSGGTPSGSTGLSSAYGGSGFYVYAEVSGSGYSNKNFWLRSGTHTLTAQPGTPYFGFRLGRYGATIGTLKVYVEEI